MNDGEDIIDELNTESLNTRLWFVLTMIEKSLGKWDAMEPFEVTIVEKPEEFEVALKLLKNMSKNDGKLVV